MPDEVSVIKIKSPKEVPYGILHGTNPVHQSVGKDIMEKIKVFSLFSFFETENSFHLKKYGNFSCTNHSCPDVS